MGRAKKRVRPQITAFVNRNFDTLFIMQLHKFAKKLGDPYEVDKRGVPHPPQLVILCLVLKICFAKTYDEIEAYVKTCQQLKDLYDTDRMPTHSVIHEAMNKTSIKYIRQLLSVALYRTNKKRNIAGDSTGFREKSSSAWFDIRIKRKNLRKDCMKLHVLVDVDTGQVLSVVTTDYKKNDCPLLKRLIRNVYGINKVTLDPAYLSRENCTIIWEKRGKPYILPKKNVKTRSKGHPAWKIMIRAYKKDKEEWLSEYHIRSFVEAVFSSIKRRWGSVLMSLKKLNKRKELLMKVLCYNIKELLYNLRADELAKSKWKICE